MCLNACCSTTRLFLRMILMICGLVASLAVRTLVLQSAAKNIFKSVPTCSKILILLWLLTISFCDVIVTFAMEAFFSVGVGNPLRILFFSYFVCFWFSIGFSLNFAAFLMFGPSFLSPSVSFFYFLQWFILWTLPFILRLSKKEYPAISCQSGMTAPLQSCVLLSLLLLESIGKLAANTLNLIDTSAS